LVIPVSVTSASGRGGGCCCLASSFGSGGGGGGLSLKGCFSVMTAYGLEGRSATAANVALPRAAVQRSQIRFRLLRFMRNNITDCSGRYHTKLRLFKRFL